jgi:hypothetical protein
MATVKAYRRHAAGDDHIYCQMMAERTGEAADNYYGRPFDMDLLDYAPSAPEEQQAWKWPLPKGNPGWPFPPDRFGT